MNEVKSGFFEAPEHFGEKQVSLKDLEWDKALYLGEITYTDYNIGLLLVALEKLDLRDNTLIVLTADHGEAFGENKDVIHGNTLYDHGIHVPLIFSGHHLGRKGVIVDELCGSVDIMPTILDYAGIPGPGEMRGNSLLPYLTSEPRMLERIGFSETMASSRKEMKQYAVVENGWKFVFTPWGTMESLFHLTSDPGEKSNLIEQYPEKARIMKEKLEGIVKANTAEDKWESLDLDAKSLEHLKSLGYIQ